MEKYLPQKFMGCGDGWGGCSDCGHSKNECNCKEEFKELIDTQKVVITDQNGVRTEHTAISEAIETNNKLDSVIVEKDGIKKLSVDAVVTVPPIEIPPVEIDKTGLATDTKQDAIITAINNKQITVDNQDVLDKMDEVITAINNQSISVDMGPTNQILTDIKNQEQTNATALLGVANAIKTELQAINANTDQTELVTEVDRIIAAIQAGGSQIDYTQKLADILAKLGDINVNVDNLEAKLDTINTSIQSLVGQYNQALADLKTELQAINANTDQVEAKLQSLIDKPGYDDTALKQLITDFKLEAKTESDQDQIQRENIINLLGNQSTKLDDEVNANDIVTAINDSVAFGDLQLPILDTVVGTKQLSTVLGVDKVRQLKITNFTGATGTVTFGGITLEETEKTDTYYNINLSTLSYVVNTGGKALIEWVK